MRFSTATQLHRERVKKAAIGGSLNNEFLKIMEPISVPASVMGNLDQII
jgi:hypothetical protein